jgi:hypothetical protein
MPRYLSGYARVLHTCGETGYLSGKLPVVVRSESHVISPVQKKYTWFWEKKIIKHSCILLMRGEIMPIKT